MKQSYYTLHIKFGQEVFRNILNTHGNVGHDYLRLIIDPKAVGDIINILETPMTEKEILQRKSFSRMVWTHLCSKSSAIDIIEVLAEDVNIKY